MPRILDSRHVLAVRDLPRSTRFYIEVLGFQRDFDDPDGGWSFLSRDNFKVMLGECPDERPASETGDHSYAAYLLVDEVDSLYEEIRSKGAEILSAPVTEPWGMREFGIRTPDGHRFRIGERAPVPSAR
jgi:predicted enzyme related to lactoylglutathione lyase